MLLAAVESGYRRLMDTTSDADTTGDQSTDQDGRTPPDGSAEPDGRPHLRPTDGDEEMRHLAGTVDEARKAAKKALDADSMAPVGETDPDPTLLDGSEETDS
jgi:hypothetical protein